MTVDGGTLNNEPFEWARWTLMENPRRKPNKRDAFESDRAVLMIDPFPERPDYDINDKLDTDLSPQFAG